MNSKHLLITTCLAVFLATTPLHAEPTGQSEVVPLYVLVLEGNKDPVGEPIERYRWNVERRGNPERISVNKTMQRWKPEGDTQNLTCYKERFRTRADLRESNPYKLYLEFSDSRTLTLKDDDGDGLVDTAKIYQPGS